MKDIQIVHLFPKLLSLYGEYGNVSILKKKLEDNGYNVIITEYEAGELDFLEAADFVYIGSGTEENILEARKRLIGKEDKLLNYINKKESGVFLATGNSMALFGEKILWKNEEFEGINVVSYTSDMKSDTRYTSDVLSSDNNEFAASVFGFINTSVIYSGIKDYIFELTFGDKFGNDKNDKFEGIKYNNFYATQLIGPLLVKNPPVLKAFYERITEEELVLKDDENLMKAYKNALEQLKLLEKNGSVN